MLKILIIFLLIATTALSSASEILKLSETQSISVDVIDGWQLTPMMAPPGMPVKTIHLVKDGTKLMITLIGSKDGNPITKSEAELSAKAQRSAEQYVPSSVEGKINIKRVSSKNIVGSYASFTDKQWMGKIIPNGEYACVTSGVFLSNGVMVATTFLSRSLNSKAYQEGLAIIQSLGK